MWLLHAQTFELRSFASAHVAPRYAILSHCWDDDEVTFVDIQELTRAQSKRGWLKVSNACSVALLQHNCQWIWIDTCCIDKSSSNELSEAINSMFDWYKWAHICLAYLGDLVDLDPSTQLLSFGRSRWFTRGWTLQELIAPNPKMVFYTATWVQIGTRSMLGDVIVRVTGINRSILWTQYDPGTLNLSIATRMSWAVGRQTTRPEDRAYSLMGLFGIKMPVIYGEGEEAAFLRLQLEIIRRSDDHTIFAWGLNDPYRTRLDRFDRPQVELKDVQSVGDIAGTSLLAPSLDAFRGSGDFDPISIGLLAQVLNLPRLREPHFYDTNMGIRIQLPIRELHQRAPATPPVLYVAALPCHIGAEKQDSYSNR
ncbi:HET-domain-containing protein [Pilatotrama ljubarskyi]|nr:HET-domain-containing protein [Pilatotrama ljubarskyi]